MTAVRTALQVSAANSEKYFVRQATAGRSRDSEQAHSALLMLKVLATTVVAYVLAQLAQGRVNRLLHLKVAVQRGPDHSPPGCSVGAPHDCPAVKRAQTASFPSDGELDACPYLQGRSDQPTSAVCGPVSMLGRSIGVLHAVAPISIHPGPASISQMKVVADQVGARISMLRVMEQTHLQAATDSLTGSSIAALWKTRCGS